MREIGSEFWTGSSPLDGRGVGAIMPAGFHIQPTLSGRTALDLLLDDTLRRKKARKAYLPSYCCHTMIQPFVSKGIQVEFYDVVFGEDGIKSDFDLDNDCDIVLLMDYFGFLDPRTTERAADQRKRGKTTIYDCTHSLFCQGLDCKNYDYVFGSFRKWVGVNAGFCGSKDDISCVLRENLPYVRLRNEAFDLKTRYMNGEQVEKSSFLGMFSDAEAMLEKDYSSYAPDRGSLRILARLDVEAVRRRRRENARLLIAGLGELASDAVCAAYGEVGGLACPLFVPLRVRPGLRDGLRRHLIEEGIYLPVHWPLSAWHQADARARIIYDAELSCVCDQRYGREDMDRIVDAIGRFAGK